MAKKKPTSKDYPCDRCKQRFYTQRSRKHHPCPKAVASSVLFRQVDDIEQSLPSMNPRPDADND